MIGVGLVFGQCSKTFSHSRRVGPRYANGNTWTRFLRCLGRTPD